jgi:hypothetical protein
MIVIGIDPGPTESAFVIWDGVKVRQFGNMNNEEMRQYLDGDHENVPDDMPVCVIEQIRGFGVMASDKLFDTCWWSGRFYEAYPGESVMLPRKEAAAHVCGQGGISKDGFVREALIARFGPPGNKKQPGMLYGISSHVWAALAVAVTYLDKCCEAAK